MTATWYKKTTRPRQLHSIVPCDHVPDKYVGLKLLEAPPCFYPFIFAFVGAMPPKRPPRAKQSTASSCASAEDHAFLHKLHLIQSQIQRVQKGCRYCGHGCFEALKADEQGILDYRRALRMLPKAAQDRDLLWIFGGGVDEPLASVLKESLGIAGEQAGEQTSPTASSNEAGPMEATSPSGCDSPKQTAGLHEITSESDDEPAEPLDPNHSPMPGSSHHEPAEARAEVTSSSSEIPPLVSEDEDEVSQRPPKKRRQYRKRRRKGGHDPSVPVQGILTPKPVLICRKSAAFLIGIGSGRLSRVLCGRADGRTKGMRLPSHASGSRGPLEVCLRFLWRKYHFDAEGLPDKFSIHRHDAESFTIGTQSSPKRTSVPARTASSFHGHDRDEVLEEEERAIADMALYIASTLEPTSMLRFGPGTHGGPTRYIGVMKPIHLYMELEAWCASQSIPKPSFQTLLRALDQCGCIRFRKTAGQHPNCDTCMHYKQRLRSPQSPQQRAVVLEEYCQHILMQWLDRGVDSNSTELSRMCRRMLDMGARLSTMARQSSFWLIRADGVDQAKFRVPRCATKTHAFDKLIRPALHVQGAWCEGFGYHFAVADADMKKDTNNNMEVIARLMESLFKRYGALPLAISLIMDNTSRECKNQKILKFGVKLVALGCVESITFLYPQKGHTHGPLDGTFGQMCVKLSLEEFDDDLGVVAILDDFLRTSGLDAGTRQDAKAYKLDEAAEWVEWAEEVDLTMSALTGPEAPHYFRICRRKHVGADSAHGDGAAEAAASHRAEHRGYQPNGDDVVMIVKDRMASLDVSQIILMLPAADLGRICGLPLQPCGRHPRRPASEADRKKVFDAARAAHSAGAIRDSACDYLTQWSRGIRRRQPRPANYHFLTHRVHSGSEPNEGAYSQPAPQYEPRPVIVAALGGNQDLPVEAEPDSDHDGGPLVIS